MKMKNSLPNKMTALMTVLVLAVGSILIVGTSQFVKGLDGDTLKNLLGGCIYGACKDTKITGNFTNATLAGCVFAGCKNVEIAGKSTSSQPSPNPTATLTVTKICIEGGTHDPVPCPFNFQITVTGNNPSPSSFQGDTAGTTVTLGPGKYTVSEDQIVLGVSFSGDCKVNEDGKTASGTIAAGETQKCLIENGTQ